MEFESEKDDINGFFNFETNFAVLLITDFSFFILIDKKLFVR